MVHSNIIMMEIDQCMRVYKMQLKINDETELITRDQQYDNLNMFAQ